MNQTSEEKNKGLALTAFDTPFNKRDYAAAERYWSPNYVQHSAHIVPGRDGLFHLIQEHPVNAEVVATARTCPAKAGYQSIIRSKMSFAKLYRPSPMP
jgi:predicted SnoaL-like aldol condensation-catalyzing enzyme